MSKPKDNHTHFTGSLPLEFIWDLLRKRKLPLFYHERTWKKIFKNLDYERCLTARESDVTEYFNVFTTRISEMFINEPNYNIKIFFEIYYLTQYWTKSNQLNEAKKLYVSGTEAIAESFHGEGVQDFEIIAGPLLDWPGTQTRIESMIEGFEKFERKFNLSSFGKIRLTFIRDKKGSYYNYSQRTLQKIFQSIDQNSRWEERIVGFDFSGVEIASNFDDQLKIINLLKAFNGDRKNRRREKLLISAHAGEDLFNNKPNDLFYYFRELLKTDIDRIGHGIFLWIPKKYLNFSSHEDYERKVLLSQIAERRIELEICPTANVLFSPISSYLEIPIKELDRLGVKYTINTDNKSIFSTNIRREYECFIDSRDRIW